MKPVRQAQSLPQHLDDIDAAPPGVKHDLSAAGPIKSGQAIEDGGLAGAVRADKRGNRAARHVQINIIQRFDAAKPHMQMRHAQYRFAHGATPLRGLNPLRLTRIRPRGRQIIISTISTPIVDPNPPSTTMARISADSKNVNEVGLTNPW
ncbi:hypothetical protein SODG_004806 [Sodalis praecaptivus]